MKFSLSRYDVISRYGVNSYTPSFLMSQHHLESVRKEDNDPQDLLYW